MVAVLGEVWVREGCGWAVSAGGGGGGGWRGWYFLEERKTCGR